MSTLSIVIPAYNEERFIGTLLEQIIAVDLSRFGLAKQIIVVDDCSRDRTAEIVAAAVRHPELHALREHARNDRRRAHGQRAAGPVPSATGLRGRSSRRTRSCAFR